jgi:hypothetical protein
LGVVLQIESHKIDITNDYQSEWLKLGFALANEFGENGRDFFHRISIFSKKYSFNMTNKQYSECLKSRKNGITIRSFFGIAKKYAIDINPYHLYQLSKNG